MSDAIGSRREFLKASSAAAAGAMLVTGNAPQAKAKNLSVAPLLMTAGASFDGGDLKGRFVYDGTPPTRKPVVITADKDFCCKQNILEENLVVDPASRGVANVIVWLYLTRDDAQPAIHSSYAETEKADVPMDCSGCRFEPHAQVLRTTQTLLIRNLNPIGDSAKIDTLSNPPINIVIPIKGQWRQSYTSAERMPARVSCSLHPWESGWLLVKEHPYMAVSKVDGSFAIKNLPPGKWTFQFWHEQSGYLTEVKFQGKATVWKRGRAEFDIKPGENDLGELVLAPGLFAT
ncbi:MAG TPA: twin-arginine translocation signal domain-containing protein [Candidatus Anammoximicrobium sp.]|nr:twin-arginine translocation signal domain-containing protein [Candidatus Anammoximicrobium sp.]